MADALFLKMTHTSMAFCCADSLCYFCLELLLIKGRKLMEYSKARLCSFSSNLPAGRLQLISDMSMRICSEAGIAESPLLVTGLLIEP